MVEAAEELAVEERALESDDSGPELQVGAPAAERLREELRVRRRAVGQGVIHIHVMIPALREEAGERGAAGGGERDQPVGVGRVAALFLIGAEEERAVADDGPAEGASVPLFGRTGEPPTTGDFRVQRLRIADRLVEASI